MSKVWKILWLPALVSSLGFGGMTARGDVAFHLQAGLGAGLMNTTDANITYGGNYAVDLEYLWMFANSWALTVGGAGMYGDFLFNQQGVNNHGSMSALGTSLGLASRSSGGFVMQFSGIYYPYSSYTYTNSTTAKVNDTTFKHATLVTLTGGSPSELRFSLINENMTGQFSKRERMRTGLVFSYVGQSFTNRTIQLDTNSIDTEPTTRVTKDSVNFSLQAITIRFLVGIAF